MDLHQREQIREVKNAVRRLENDDDGHQKIMTINKLPSSNNNNNNNNSKVKIFRVASVVYYLSRNGQLEHPHFMEVPFSSPHQGLFLSDAINRLNALRGKGMASMYSWSCKRSYKNGFVWHDLSENDLIYPASSHGNVDEYVLKGSEINLDLLLHLRQNQPDTPVVTSSNVHSQQQDENRGGDAEYHRRPPTAVERRRRNQSCSSVDFGHNNDRYSVYGGRGDQSSSCRFSSDVATQTDDHGRRQRRSPHAAGEGGPVVVGDKNFHEIVEETAKEVRRDREEIEISPPPSDSTTSPETLETLMKADGLLILRTEDPTANNTNNNNNHLSSSTKASKSSSSSSVLKHLISCGSVSFKDCGAGQGLGLGLISHIRMPRVGVRLEEKEYFSGSLVETQKLRDCPPGTLKRSTSYHADR